ncbi:MAG TPA: glycoside hydrolase family 9 protein, partial [Chitinophagaceae bacterium]|nr:glycoside hydrolase family 9 protein [Chitinophagaceae bacterium]
DHMGMRIPKEDTNYYGKGLERPVYFVSGEPQQRGKFMNNTTGTSSTAAKFASAFALGFEIFGDKAHYFNVVSKKANKKFGDTLFEKAFSAHSYANIKLGNAQTASVRSPYIYAEDNWVDDMELADAAIYSMTKGWVSEMGFHLLESYNYAQREKLTPWLGTDTANHYQWYPFINIGHYELAKELNGKERETIIGFYREGINRVWSKARQNAFYRGIPFIWCSNNLTTSFAIQCYWYKQLTGDKTFEELEQANFDWLFGCNQWGTSMIYGLPSWGDTPVDPHSAFTHLKNYPIDGGLVDGPVYTSIFKNLIGIQLKDADEYAEFQSDLAVYHDDYGDYSTNEPTMDGTASLIYLLAAKEAAPSKSRPKGETSPQSSGKNFSYSHGGIIRGDSTKKNIALVFTGHEFAEGGEFINQTLQQQKIKASFFFTGKFYENPSFKTLVGKLIKNGNLMGPHSYEHLLYCDWNKRDSLLVAQKEFMNDLLSNLDVMYGQGINTLKLKYFLPPYEWYNDSITTWTKQLGLQLINYTPGTVSHADYTTSKDKNYRSSETIYNSIINYEKAKPAGLNGFILLMHVGAGPDRTDKFYTRLPELIKYLKQKGYQFQTVDQLLSR